MFTALQFDDALRGLNRCARTSPIHRDTESIQPTHSASTTASSQVSPWCACPFGRRSIHTSGAVSWCRSSQARNAVASSKNTTTGSTSLTGATLSAGADIAPAAPAQRSAGRFHMPGSANSPYRTSTPSLSIDAVQTSSDSVG